MRAITKRAWLAVTLTLVALAASLGYRPLRAQDEWKERDRWQRPAEVMDALGVKAASVVGDVGAGEGYFTFHLAERVGPQGKIYAEDILENDLEKIHRKAEKEKLAQIETILGTPKDPRLPEAALDSILVVNAFHEMLDYDAMLQGMYRALKPGGLLAIIDARAKPGKKREVYQEHHTLPQQLARQDADRNGFHFLHELPGFKSPQRDRQYYFLIFEKPKK